MTHAISTTWRPKLSSGFFPCTARKEIHTILTETLGEHAPSYATIRNWVAQFKRGDFSTCDVSRPRPKTVTTPEITDQIHELILEDCWISAKSIAEQLGISCVLVGSIIREDLDMWKLPRSGSRNAWTRIKKINGASRLSNFQKFFSAIQMISCSSWWPWTKPGYITMTRRQSNNQWSSGIAAHPAPKNSECKNPLEKFSLRFLGIKMASSSFIAFQRAKLSMRSFTHLCWCNWMAFWRKNAVGGSPRWSCSCMTMSRLTGHLQLRRNWRTWASHVLITHPILWIWPRRTTTCSLDWKNNWKVTLFHLTRRSLMLRRPGWTDNLLNFF